MFGRTRKDAPPTDAADANTPTTQPTTTEASKPGATPGADAAAAKEAASANNAATDSAAATDSPPADDFDDRVEKRVREILAKEREAEERTAADRAMAEAWVARNAPGLVGHPLAKRLFAGTKTNEDRQAAINEFRDYFNIHMKQLGVRIPDVGASAEKEGGHIVDPDRYGASDRVSAASKAAEELHTRRL